MLQVCREIATKETISKIEKWNYKFIADKGYWEEIFMEEIDYHLSTIQSNKYLQMYKLKAIYSIHYLPNKFVVPFFVLSEHPISISYFVTYLLNLNNIHFFCLDMVWNPSIDLLLYYCLFCDDNMKKVRKYATLYPHLNYI